MVCDVVEPRTLPCMPDRAGPVAGGVRGELGASPESYRTWDAGRRAPPPKVLARARALATHQDDHKLLPLSVLALLIGVHVKTLRAAARDGRRETGGCRSPMTPGRLFAAFGPARLPPPPERFDGRTMDGRFAQPIVAHH